MKRFFVGAFLAGCLGCVEMTPAMRESTSHSHSHVAPNASIAPSVNTATVNAEQVTAANARQMAQALWDECDREDLAPLASAQKQEPQAKRK